MAKDSMYAINRSDEYLAHYGIKGMKWGVRKAIAAGGTGLGNRKLARQYKKAQKKLAKLEKRANNGAKYARRAAALGAGAAAAGGLAALGAKGVGRAISDYSSLAGRGSKLAGNAMKGIGGAMTAAAYRLPGSANSKMAIRNAGLNLTTKGNALVRNEGLATATMDRAGRDLRKWSRQNTLATKGADAVSRVQNRMTAPNAVAGDAITTFGNKSRNISGIANQHAENIARNRAAVSGISNNQIARAGAAALGLGLAGAAGYNAYRAATTKRAARKAAEFRNEMNKTFAGTAYGKQGGSNGNKKRRRR